MRCRQAALRTPVPSSCVRTPGASWRYVRLFIYVLPTGGTALPPQSACTTPFMEAGRSHRIRDGGRPGASPPHQRLAAYPRGPAATASACSPLRQVIRDDAPPARVGREAGLYEPDSRKPLLRQRSDTTEGAAGAPQLTPVRLNVTRTCMRWTRLHIYTTAARVREIAPTLNRYLDLGKTRIASVFSDYLPGTRYPFA